MINYAFSVLSRKSLPNSDCLLCSILEVLHYTFRSKNFELIFYVYGARQ